MTGTLLISRLPKKGCLRFVTAERYSQFFRRILIEFWAVATRPVINNGLGFTHAQAAEELVNLKTLFALLPDTPEIFPEWESIVLQYRVSGKQAHDARLVAAMRVHNLTHLLTFNIADFKRFTSYYCR